MTHWFLIPPLIPIVLAAISLVDVGTGDIDDKKIRRLSFLHGVVAASAFSLLVTSILHIWL